MRPRHVPLNALPFFEAAARLGSLTMAAAELCVTPGAASRQVKSLEAALGVALFRRRNNAIELTDEGQALLAYVTDALGRIRTGSRMAASRGSRLVVRAPLTLAQRWLIPRLGVFRQMHPEVDLWVKTIGSGAPVDPDVEIRYTRGDAADPAHTQGRIILHDRIAAVCRPGSRFGDARTAADLLQMPILLDTFDGWSWQRWCDIAGIPFLPARGTTTLDTDEAAIVACLAGFGVALATSAFVAPLIAAGELDPLCPQIHPVIGVYRAVALSSSPTALAFTAWLAGLEQRGLEDYPGPRPAAAARGQTRSHAASGKPVGRR